MRGKWVNSSIYTYNTLLNYWLHEQGKTVDARSMKKLGLNGLSPNIVTHSIWMEEMFKRGDVKKAEDAFCKMKSMKPTVDIFSVFI